MGERLQDGLAEPTKLPSGLAVASAAKIPPLVREGGVGGRSQAETNNYCLGFDSWFPGGICLILLACTESCFAAGGNGVQLLIQGMTSGVTQARGHPHFLSICFGPAKPWARPCHRAGPRTAGRTGFQH